MTWDRSADGYRLATEAEWEMAARGGKVGMYAGGELDAVAWYGSNSGGTTHKVCTKQPNALGLCDATGNVWEWTWDWYGDFPADAVTDPVGPGFGLNRVIRGGSWYDNPLYVRVAGRDLGVGRRGYGLGLRLVRSSRAH